MAALAKTNKPALRSDTWINWRNEQTDVDKIKGQTDLTFTRSCTAVCLRKFTVIIKNPKRYESV